MNNGKHVVNHLFFRRKFDLVDDNELAVMLVTNVTNEFEAEAQQSILMGNDQTANFTTANSVYKSQKLREALQKPLLPSRMEQNCFVRFFLTTLEGAVFLSTQ